MENIDVKAMFGSTIKEHVAAFQGILKDPDFQGTARQGAEEYLEALKAGAAQELAEIEAALTTLPRWWFSEQIHERRVVLTEVAVMFTK